MTFFTRSRVVEAQQYAGRPEWITLVELIHQHTESGIACFKDAGIVHAVLPHDWIVKWEDGSFDVFSSMDFEYRFTTEDNEGSLKRTINRLADKLLGRRT